MKRAARKAVNPDRGVVAEVEHKGGVHRRSWLLTYLSFLRDQLLTLLLDIQHLRRPRSTRTHYVRDPALDHLFHLKNALVVEARPCS